ncbi:40S ribosomal protein S5-1 [Hordeum vulgare]|nr:40S ribosomal protein S5-1 [Hordeum vulgare]
MTSPRPSKDKFFEKVINPYLSEVMKHPQAIDMSNGVLHIRDVQSPKKEGSEKARLAAMEQEIFKCQGIVERGLSANHSMITDFIRENKLDTKSMGLYSKSSYFKTHEELETQTDELEAAKAAALPAAKVVELHRTLADVRGKRDEISGERDRLGKELGVEQAATALLKAELAYAMKVVPKATRTQRGYKNLHLLVH